MRRKYRRRGQNASAILAALLIIAVMAVLILCARKWKQEKIGEDSATAETESMAAEETEKAQEDEVTVFITFPSVTFSVEEDKVCLPSVTMQITARPGRISAIREAYMQFAVTTGALDDLYTSLESGLCDCGEAIQLMQSENAVLREKADAAFENCLLLGGEEVLSGFLTVVRNEALQIDKLCAENPKNALELSGQIRYTYSEAIEAMLSLLTQAE